jgi:hypothetical protein
LSSSKRSAIHLASRQDCHVQPKETLMNQIVYIVGAVVIVVAVLSFVGLA